MGKRTVAPGIYRDAHGYEVRVTWKGRTARRRFPSTARRSSMTAWRVDQIAALRRLDPAVQRGTLAADAETYLALPQVAAMPSHANRTHIIHEWVTALGGQKPRWKLTAREISAALDEMARVKAWTPGTKHIYRAALAHLYVTLDGKNAPNPVRDVARPVLPPAENRAIPADHLAAILAHLGPLTPVTARVLVLAHTGIPPATLGRLTPADVALDEPPFGWVTLPRRRKARGAAAIRVPLVSPDAREAFAAFVRLEAWGPQNADSMRREFRAAAKRAGLGARGYRLYDLRHTFAARMYVTTGGRGELVAHLLQHAAGSSVTSRYTVGGVPQALVDAIGRTVPSDRATETPEPSGVTVH